MPTPLPPEAKQQVLAAYRKFQASLAAIAKRHHAAVGRVIGEVDQTRAADIRKKISGT